jgi:hypothetical protein
MSPELERLLEALYEKLTCPPEEKSHRVATFERLLQDVLARRPGTSRDELLNAFHEPTVRSPGFSRSGPPEGGTPNKWRPHGAVQDPNARHQSRLGFP